MSSIVFTVTRTTFHGVGNGAGYSTEVLGVADSLIGGVTYARKLVDKYYAGQTGTERDRGWGVTEIDLPNVPGTYGVRLTVAPVVKVSQRTQV